MALSFAFRGFACILLFVTALVCAPAHGAPGFTYEAVYTNGQFANQNLVINQAAINNSGRVVFTTVEQLGFGPRTFRVYAADRGQAPQLVLETGDIDNALPGPFIYAQALGLNDNGVVAIPLIWNVFDENDEFVRQDVGHGLFEPGVGQVGEIRGTNRSSGRLNNSLQMGSAEYPAGSTTDLVITDGTVSAATNAPGIVLATVQTNDAGTVATSTVSGINQKIVVQANPPGTLRATEVGDSLSLGYNSFPITPGLNSRGWMSFSTDNDLNNYNANPRVLLIDPAGQVFLVAETANSDFGNFRQPRQPSAKGVGLNNYNRVSFVADSIDGSNSVWIGDASGDAPRLAMESMVLNRVPFTDGRGMDVIGFSNDVTNIGPNSFNDTGEIAVIAHGSIYNDQGVQILSSTQALLVARPVVGSEPGTPVIPELADALPDGGWRLRGRCWRETVQDIPGSCDATGGVNVVSPRLWIDPPIAVGYDYIIDETSTGAFTSVLIPAPLPGGDSDFQIEVNGAVEAFQSGAVLNFSTITPDPVRAFRIVDIDQAENFDPNDPAAFVTGVTFSVETDEDISYTMVPVIFDPADIDGDGVPDKYDDFPNDPMLAGDTDGDGIDDIIDTDDDGDGVVDSMDDYPWGRFDDAAPGYWSFTFVEALARAGITAGCGGDNYCPSDPVTRAQMAVFLERGINGRNYVAPPASGNVFLDVGANDFAAGFIEQLFADGITVGCGNDNYCPGDTVTRAQMAVFLLRARYGSNYSPPAPTGLFADVPTGYWAAAWIEQLAADGITAGCGNGDYCPADEVTRDQMAVFLVRTFEL